MDLCTACSPRTADSSRFLSLVFLVFFFASPVVYNQSGPRKRIFKNWTARRVPFWYTGRGDGLAVFSAYNDSDISQYAIDKAVHTNFLDSCDHVEASCQQWDGNSDVLAHW